MTVAVEVKRFVDWKGNLNEFLAVGDLVDDEMANYFLEVLPPLTWKETMIQCSEPYDRIGGKYTYATFIRSNNKDNWQYAGHCHKGEPREPVRGENDYVIIIDRR